MMWENTLPLYDWKKIKLFSYFSGAHKKENSITLSQRSGLVTFSCEGTYTILDINSGKNIARLLYISFNVETLLILLWYIYYICIVAFMWIRLDSI